MSISLNTKIEELVLVLGAHRSGVSRLTQIVAGLDYDLPGDQLTSRSIVSIHQRFLNDIGSHWNDPCPLPKGVFEGEEAEVARNSIHEFLAEVNIPFLVINDPGLCRLLPLWTSALKSFDCKVRGLEIIRDPKGVFDSLRRNIETSGKINRGINSRDHSNLLWWRRVTEARTHVQGLEFLTIAFESLINEPQRQLESIQAFLDKKGHSPSFTIAKVQDSSSAFTPDMTAASDTEQFLHSVHIELLRSKKPVPEPHTDIPAPFDLPAHPWPGKSYEAIAAASLKHLSGTLPRSKEYLSAYLNTHFNNGKRPIDALFISDKPTWPSHIYRVKNPVDALSRSGLRAVWLDKQSIIAEPKLLDRALRVIVHRLDWGPDFSKIVQECRRRHIPVGYDLDDLLFLPELIASGARDSVTRLGPHEIQRWIQRSEEIQRCMREADFFIGATQSIKAAAAEFNQDCRYICNGFSPENLLMANLARAHSKSDDEETVNIGYASGTATHQADFDVVAGTLWQLMREDPRLFLTIVGPLELQTRPPADVEERISIRPLVPHVNLPFELARFDINIAPLERNAFCDAKSPLKFFEAGLVDVPTIATNNPTYENVGAKSRGCLLASDQANWYQHLRRLSRDTAFRKKLGNHAHQTAIDLYHCDLTVDLYKNLPRKRYSGQNQP